MIGRTFSLAGDVLRDTEGGHCSLPALLQAESATLLGPRLQLSDQLLLARHLRLVTVLRVHAEARGQTGHLHHAAARVGSNHEGNCFTLSRWTTS